MTSEQTKEINSSWELAFRTQLILEEQREIFDYWNRLRVGREMPARLDVDPAEMTPYLPLISLTEIDDENGRFKVRLAGTRFRDIFDEEITGKYVDDLGFGDQHDYWMAAYDRVRDQRRPAQGVAPVNWRDKGDLFAFWMRLPLSKNDDHVDMMLGLDVFLVSAKADALSKSNGLSLVAK
jgi:hypothetical protein